VGLFLETPEFSTKSDVYAFGMLLVYIFKKDHPCNGKSLEEIKAQSKLEENQVVRDIQSDNFPILLGELIKSCIKPEKDRRPEVADFLLRKQFGKIIDQLREMKHGSIGKVWQNEEEGISGQRDELSWPDFKNAWGSFDPNNLTKLNELCLRAFMGISLDPLATISGLGPDVSIEPKISRVAYERFADTFKDVTPGVLYNNLYQLVLEPWFFGLLSYHRAAKILKDFASANKNATQVFLVIQKKDDELSDEVKDKGPFILLQYAKHQHQHHPPESLSFDWSHPIHEQLLRKFSDHLPPSPPRDIPVFKRLQPLVQSEVDQTKGKPKDANLAILGRITAGLTTFSAAIQGTPRAQEHKKGTGYEQKKIHLKTDDD